ncbi:MAG: hypothetical protein WBC40_03450 [Halobacteriota archaeon]
MKKEVSKFLRYGIYTVAFLLVISDYYYNLQYFAYDAAMAVGATTWSVIGIFIALYCADKCSKWASEIENSPNLAFLLGFSLGLLTLLLYWVYYNSKKKEYQRIIRLEEEIQALKGGI